MSFGALGGPLSMSAYADMLAVPAAHEFIIEWSDGAWLSADALRQKEKSFAVDIMLLGKGPRRDQEVNAGMMLQGPVVDSVQLCTMFRLEGERRIVERTAMMYDHKRDGLKGVRSWLDDNGMMELNFFWVPRAMAFKASFFAMNKLSPGGQMMNAGALMFTYDCTYCAARGDICSCSASMFKGMHNHSLLDVRGLSVWERLRKITTYQAKSGWMRFGGEGGPAARFTQLVGHGVEGERIQRLLSGNVAKMLQYPAEPPEQQALKTTVEGSPKVDGNYRAGVRKHRCMECGQRFKYPSHLKRHIEGVHAVQSKHTCTQCSKAFSQRGHLLAHHHHVHEKRERYACEVCGADFAWKTNLNKHRLRHSEVSSALKS